MKNNEFIDKKKKEFYSSIALCVIMLVAIIYMLLSKENEAEGKNEGIYLLLGSIFFLGYSMFSIVKYIKIKNKYNEYLDINYTPKNLMDLFIKDYVNDSIFNKFNYYFNGYNIDVLLNYEIKEKEIRISLIKEKREFYLFINKNTINYSIDMFNEVPDFESDIVEISEKLNDGLFDDDKIWLFIDSDFEEFNFNEYYLDDNYKNLSNYIIDKLTRLEKLCDYYYQNKHLLEEDEYEGE